MKAIGINPERLQMYNLSAAMGSRFAEICWEMTERVKRLGPNPVKTGKGKEVALLNPAATRLLGMEARERGHRAPS